MNGRLATGLLALTGDISQLDDGGFWVVSTTFEGQAICAKFEKIVDDQPFPTQPDWELIQDRWKSSLSKVDFESYVQEIREQISWGNVYQVNACRILTAQCFVQSIAPLFAETLKHNPAQYATFLRLPEIEIASASPELFLRRDGDTVLTSPMKGTRAYETGSGFGEKDVSENLMIVDLMRNDLGRIATIGTVKATALFREEDHPGLIQLVSDVQANLRSEITWKEIFQNLLPPGSVSGAPKIAATTIIANNEPVNRENYCGTFGWIHGDQALLNVAIRTFWKKGSVLSYGTGAGITWGSDPGSEWEETELKTANLLRIAGGFNEFGWPFDNGIFETIRTEFGTPLLLAEHLARAERSAKTLGMTFPEIPWIHSHIIEPHKESLKKFPIGRLRLTFGKQIGVYVEEYQESRNPLRICTVSVAAIPGIGQHKTYPYIKNLKLLAQGTSRGFDEVLLVDPLGVIGEGAISNYAFLIDGDWLTPHEDAGVLPGIVRALALKNQLISEKELTIEEVRKSQSVIALSSMKIAQPVGEMDDINFEVGAEVFELESTLRQICGSNSVG
jgi:para-aminobenzoate synthetase component 1